MPLNPAIDAEYDPERRAGPRQPFIDWYIRESALARERLECRLDVPYGPTKAETFDVFPASMPGSPVLMYIHGGYWRALSSKEFSFVAAGLVPHGLTVAVMNYGLCPAVTIADITRQSRAAVAWLGENARQFCGDPGRLFVAGHSAGGQQVGMLLSDTGSSSAIRGGITISGIFDLRPLRQSWLQPTLQLTQPSAQEQSPLLRIPGRAPPLFATVGGDESDALIGQTRDYLAAWTGAGLDGVFFPQPGVNHYQAVYGLGDRASPLAKALADFVR